MSKLEPIACVLKQDSEIITQPRWLGCEQAELLLTGLQSILKRMLTRPIYNFLYGSQAFLVPKTSSDKYRMIVDMSKLNQQNRWTNLMMPNSEQQVSYPRGAKFCSSFDILSGFDYLPVAEDIGRYFV